MGNIFGAFWIKVLVSSLEKNRKIWLTRKSFQKATELSCVLCNREGKNGSEKDILCEPDMSGLLADLLCTLWTSCGPAVASIIFCLQGFTAGPAERSRSNILFCYLTRQVHTGGSFFDMIRPSWFFPLMDMLHILFFLPKRQDTIINKYVTILIKVH